MQRECEAKITINAPPEDIWRVVSDITRVGEWSVECRGCEWTDGASQATPGARFRGRNRRGTMRWTRLNEVEVADAPHEFVWRTVSTPLYRDSTQWRLTLAPAPDVTEVTESFRILGLSRPMEWVLGIVMPAHRDRSADLAADLARLKKVVEGAHPVT